MSQHHQPAFTIACEACGVDTDTDSANEIVAFYRRHHRQTGHDVVLTRADLEFDLPVADDDLESVVAELEAHYDDGVPIGVVAAVMSERGYAVGETLEEIDDVRMTGALYEPRDDHLAAV
ncbi:hypothetical protein [Natronorubrum aibiense]|uniref:Uncharacterized protein n=1 Tax=Natronorubrum aibiense TaxID=348826 RepID=A0A5P9P2B7_9EURY|nr:hypothetical protein [Natronorubrum aibiense]QFU82176.1 hypothetical protein GCU68_06345 [Natronorubrum aibiense]